VAYGVHGLLLTGVCGGRGNPCPPEATPYVIAVGFGVPVAIIAGLAWSGWTAFVVFPALAVGAIWAGFDLPPGEPARDGAFIAAGAFLAPAMLPFVRIPFAVRKRRRAQRLATQGGQAIGTAAEQKATFLDNTG